MNFKSKYEKETAQSLSRLGVSFGYESEIITWTKKSPILKYKPDFIVETLGTGKKIYIEMKGFFKSSDRAKMKRVKECNPTLDIRIVFQRASNKLNKVSKLTYKDWAIKNGFLWADKVIPKEWLYE